MIEELDQDAWLRFAGDAGITLPFFRRRIIAMTDAVLSVVDEGRASSLSPAPGVGVAILWIKPDTSGT